MGASNISKWKGAGFLLLAALGIMYAAFCNGYPLVTSDSGSYILTGFKFQMPADRPPFYGFFLRHSSLRTSLWFTVFAQSALLSFLLCRLSAIVYDAGAPVRLYITGFVFIISFTCVSWVSSFIMADVFAAILLLAVTLYVYGPAKKGAGAAYLIIIACATLMHNSHFIILLLVAVYLLAVALIKKTRPLAAKAAIMLCVALACFTFVGSINFFRDRGFTFSKGSHIFMMGKLAETGILNAYLDDNCATRPRKLCNYKDDLPAVAYGFVWDNNSPLYKTGGWDNSKQEYDSIIHDVFTTPKYIKMFAIKSLISTCRQLTQINIPARPLAHREGSSPYAAIHAHFYDEQREYLSSAQNQNSIDVGVLNIIYNLFFICSTVFVLWYLPGLPDGRRITAIYALLAALIVINAFTTATFANVLDRLQNRVWWLLPAMNAILLARYLYELRMGSLMSRKSEQVSEEI
jgi:hypothetical protein